MKPLARISNEEYDPLSLGLSATAESAFSAIKHLLYCQKYLGRLPIKSFRSCRSQAIPKLHFLFSKDF